MTYTPPINEMIFMLEKVVGLNRLPEHSDFGVIDAEMAQSILAPAAKLASEILAPLNAIGDQKGASLQDNVVTTAPGFKDAYQEYCEGGWNAVPFSPDHGGQGLPWLIAFAVQEMWQGANMSFGLCPLLNQGAIEAIESHGSDAQKEEYLEKLISGEWTGTMNLTEPQAGSDLSAIRTKAVPQDDGSFKISGQKIFITYGEHDMAENIIHLVLARTPDAPEGVKGISLFIVPKFLNDGTRNDLVCTGLEHKMGIHASPTCTMVFGDNGGATGFLVGTENEGLKYMFTMMNNARLSVGLQGVAIGEAAVQQALAYAQDRGQGSALSDKNKKSVAIIDHPDVKHMLLTMRSMVMAGRAMAYDAALALDLANGGDATAQAKVEVMTPLVKSWCTDMSVEVASLGIQVHGGMGFIEETGAAQFMRDARILPIYEGTNGIQAADLVFRKVLRDKGVAAGAYLDELRGIVKGLSASENKDIGVIADALEGVLALQDKANEDLAKLAGQGLDHVAAASSNYLRLFATLAGGVMLGKMAGAAAEGLSAGDGDPVFLQDKIHLAKFYAQQILPRCHGTAAMIPTAADTVLG